VARDQPTPRPHGLDATARTKGCPPRTQRAATPTSGRLRSTACGSRSEGGTPLVNHHVVLLNPPGAPAPGTDHGLTHGPPYGGCPPRRCDHRRRAVVPRDPRRPRRVPHRAHATPCDATTTHTPRRERGAAAELMNRRGPRYGGRRREQRGCSAVSPSLGRGGVGITVPICHPGAGTGEGHQGQPSTAASVPRD
jgi:hypothetical protein